MPGRRREERFTLCEPLDATLRLIIPAIVDRYSDGELWVISDAPAARDDVFTFQRIGAGPPLAVQVRVADSDLTMVAGELRQRLRLTPAEQCSADRKVNVLAVLARPIHVRLREISSTGCRVESAAPVDLGAVGELQVTANDEAQIDPLRIVRCTTAGDTSGLYHIGAEFLWHMVDERSVRRAGARTAGGKTEAQRAPWIDTRRGSTH